MKIILESIASECQDGDIVVVSEKAISVALGRVVDEALIRPSFLAKVLARIWTRLGWGYFLGPLCRLRDKTLWRLRRYPIPQGEVHKQVALQYAGFGQALLHYSEGGIDVTNLPYALVSLPLNNPDGVGQNIRKAIQEVLGKQVTVMITDTDKTYSRKGTHLTPRPGAVRGVRSLGIVAFILGRTLRWTARATPLTVDGASFSLEEALSAAEAADRARGHGAGRTAWDMARRFRVELTGITWEMLDSIGHYPIVLVRKLNE